jgi:hypothetical protein
LRFTCGHRRSRSQVVGRSLPVDDGSRGRVEERRDDELVGEGNADRGRGLAGGILLVDLLDRDQQAVCTTLSKTMSHRSSCWPGWVKKLNQVEGACSTFRTWTSGAAAPVFFNLVGML